MHQMQISRVQRGKNWPHVPVVTALRLPLGSPDLLVGEGGDGMNSTRKEGLIDVGGHVVGGAANDPRKGALRSRPQHPTAFQASAQKGDILPTGSAAPPASRTPVLMAPVVVLSAAPARCDGSLRGPGSPAAGGGIPFASAARTPIAYNKEPASATHASR